MTDDVHTYALPLPIGAASLVTASIGGGKTRSLSEMAARILKGPRRPPPPQVELPKVSQYVVARLGDRLKETSGSIRTPLATAAFLTLLVEMWQSEPKIPFPARQQVADHLDISLPAVDVALSSRQDTGDIRINYEIIRGNVSGRNHSSIRQRFVVPADWIIDFVNKAKEEEALASVPVKRKVPRKLKDKLKDTVSIVEKKTKGVVEPLVALAVGLACNHHTLCDKIFSFMN